MIPKSTPRSTTISTFQVLPKPSQNPPQTHSKPSKMESKSALGPSKTPDESHICQVVLLNVGSPKKWYQKVPQETPRDSQTPPKTLPKPSPNPSKIHQKTHAKNTLFLEPFFSRFSPILASKTTYFSIVFWCMLSSKFHRFLGPFPPPTPLHFD